MFLTHLYNLFIYMVSVMSFYSNIENVWFIFNVCMQYVFTPKYIKEKTELWKHEK